MLHNDEEYGVTDRDDGIIVGIHLYEWQTNNLLSPRPDTQPMKRDPYSHLSALQRAVLLKLHEAGPSSPKGVSIKSIARAVNGLHRGIDAEDIA